METRRLTTRRKMTTIISISLLHRSVRRRRRVGVFPRLVIVLCTMNPAMRYMIRTLSGGGAVVRMSIRDGRSWTMTTTTGGGGGRPRAAAGRGGGGGGTDGAAEGDGRTPLVRQPRRRGSTDELYYAWVDFSGDAGRAAEEGGRAGRAILCCVCWYPANF